MQADQRVGANRSLHLDLKACTVGGGRGGESGGLTPLVKQTLAAPSMHRRENKEPSMHRWALGRRSVAGGGVTDVLVENDETSRTL